MICTYCGDRGLIRVAYHTGEPFDVAICDCRIGQPYRMGGEALVRARLALDATHRVSTRDAFDDEAPAQASPVNYLESAKRLPKAKL